MGTALRRGQVPATELERTAERVRVVNVAGCRRWRGDAARMPFRGGNGECAGRHRRARLGAGVVMARA